jgi:hypothetical protein
MFSTPLQGVGARHMNKPFEVCLPLVLPLSKVRNLEKVNGKRGLNHAKRDVLATSEAKTK